MSITKPIGNVLDAINRSVSFDVFMQNYPTNMAGFIEEIADTLEIPMHE